MPTTDQHLAFCTVVTRNHLHYARVLARSLQATHPDAPVYVCVADQAGQTIDGLSNGAPGNIAWLSGDALNADSWKRFAFQYSAFELCCALKPFLMQHVLRLGYGRVVYLDADICVYSSVAEVFAAPDELSVGLTPHLLDPIPWDGKYPDERTILSAGTYNGGFLAVTNAAESHRFLDWWRDRLSDKCVLDMAKGVFVDQRWLDLVPGLFDHVRIHRRPGFHVAYWNLLHAWIEQSAAGQWLLNGNPIAFVHFSGIDIRSTDTISKYQDRLNLEECPRFADLLAAYVRDLQAAGAAQFRGVGYPFDYLTDGTPIEPGWRTAIRTGHPLLAGIDDPFDVAATPNLVHHLARASVGPMPFVSQERQAVEVILPLARRGFNPLRDMGRLFLATISPRDSVSSPGAASRQPYAAIVRPRTSREAA
jgi:hypothetical protein